MRTSPVIFIRLVSSRKERTDRNVVFPLPVVENVVLIVEVSVEVSVRFSAVIIVTMVSETKHT